MADVTAIWAEILPEVKNGVTGVGVWQALNQAKPVALDEGSFILGVPNEVGDLAGHLRLQQTKSLIERMMTQRMGQTITLRVIDGITQDDYEIVKRRDAEARRLQEQAILRQRAELQSRTSWDSVYDQLSRKFASIPNKSLPQNKARFYEEAIALMLESLEKMPIVDDLGERNYARCIERIATYAEMPSTLVAMHVMERRGS